MKKALFISLFFLLSFITAELPGQQSNSGTENLPGPEPAAEVGNKPEKTTDVSPSQNNIKEIIKNKSENSAEEPANNQKTQNDKPAKTIKASENINAKTAEQKQLTNIKIVADKPVNSNNLLEISEGDFKYRRIPGITLVNEKRVDEKITDSGNVKAENPVAEENAKGLFGLKKSTSDLLVKIFLVCLILGIIILFKIRSKTQGDKKVLRRFPGD
ncbi:MAG: hypothetical protein V1874_04000 [Spirochaetota bacterium]